MYFTLMICPQCGTEYREGFDMCTDCHVPLIPKMDWGPEDKKGGKTKLVCIFSTGSQAQIAVAKSLLDGADIPFMVKNEGVQDLLGFGRMGTGYNPLTGPIEIWVDEKDSFQAKEIISDLDNPSEEEDDEE